VLRLHEMMQTSPFITAAKAVERTRLTKPTVNAALDALTRLGIVEEVSGKQRGRIYAYRAYLDILGDGVQPLAKAP
jgi:Fic family protein